MAWVDKKEEREERMDPPRYDVRYLYPSSIFATKFQLFT